MKMPRDERWIDICPTQFAPHETGRWALPDRVLNVYDRRHQRDVTKIPLNHSEKRAELLAAAFAQYCHQLSQLDYPLTQPFRIADEIGSDRELAVPVAARDT